MRREKFFHQFDIKILHRYYLKLRGDFFHGTSRNNESVHHNAD